MLLDGAGELVEMFKSSFPFSFLFFVPFFILISPVSRAGAAHDFAVHRMQQYDLQGASHGCRSALVNVEARPLGGVGFTRKCIIAKLRELSLDVYKSAVQSNAGGLLVLLPNNLTRMADDDKEHLVELEQELMEEATQLPVYFTPETPELLDIYADIVRSTNADQAGSALEALLSSATSNGFQLVVAGPQQKELSDFQIVNIQGKLPGYGVEDQLPTIAIVAHYDAYGIAPSLSFGADSNGSGVVALLELARLFARLYTNARNHAKYNLLFLLTGAGKFNFQGTRRWLEDQIESGEGGLMSDVAYVLCLDTLGGGDALYAHVSKPPKPGSATDVLVKNLESLTGSVRRGEKAGSMPKGGEKAGSVPDGGEKAGSVPEGGEKAGLVPEGEGDGAKFRMVHKKINLAEDYLAWEHERFSIRRLPALTVSHLESYRSPLRGTILDTRDAVDTRVLAANIKVIAEAVARQAYNLTGDDVTDVFSHGVDVDEEYVRSWLDYLTAEPRAAQLMSKESALLGALEQALARHLKDVRRHSFKPDKRDPEVTFYSGAEYVMNSYSVKPAVFDLFLALAIAGYLAVVYFLLQNFHFLYDIVKRLQSSPAKKVQ